MTDAQPADDLVGHQLGSPAVGSAFLNTHCGSRPRVPKYGGTCMRSRYLAFLLAMAAGLVTPVSARAQEAHSTFVAEMTGFEETPPAATLAKGFAGIQVSHDSNSVYYAIAVTDASTQLVAAHLHFAPRSGGAGRGDALLSTDDPLPDGGAGDAGLVHLCLKD